MHHCPLNLTDIPLVATQKSCPVIHYLASNDHPRISADELIRLRAEVEILRFVAEQTAANAEQSANTLANWVKTDGPEKFRNAAAHGKLKVIRGNPNEPQKATLKLQKKRKAKSMELDASELMNDSHDDDGEDDDEDDGAQLAAEQEMILARKNDHHAFWERVEPFIVPLTEAHIQQLAPKHYTLDEVLSPQSRATSALNNKVYEDKKDEFAHITTVAEGMKLLEQQAKANDLIKRQVLEKAMETYVHPEVVAQLDTVEHRLELSYARYMHRRRHRKPMGERLSETTRENLDERDKILAYLGRR